MGKRGVKSAKGQPENEFGEVKSTSLTVTLTETGKKGLTERLAAAGLSPTRFLELLGRGYVDFQVREPDNLLPPPPLPLPEEKLEPKTIQEALAGKSAEELAAKSNLPMELIQCILDGDRATAREAIALARATPGISGSQMRALAKKQYDR